MQSLEIQLLGEFNLQVNGRSLPALNADRPQTLLAYLLLHRQAPQSRRHIAFLLWPDSSEAQALSNLRYLLHTLRHNLPEADSYLAADKLTLQWLPQLPVCFDVADFEDALLAAQQTADPPTARRRLEQAVGHYRGDLLPANYDDWLIPLRDDLARRYRTALTQLIDLLSEAGAYGPAADYGQQLVQQDPLNEGHTIRLMHLFALAGERSAVRRVYQNCVALLEQELGVEPEPATQAAYEEALSQAAVPSAPTPVLAPPAPRPLPQPPTPFIGREMELHEVGRLLADPTCRLLTITGPGGMGKTRLALQTAVSQQTHFRDGVAYVSLRSLNSAAYLAATIASALNLTLAGQPDTRSQLLHLLARREMLILLDNFEHLLNGVDLIADILAQAGGIKLLVTSRQRLDLQEEWSFALGELALPAAAALPEAIANSSAVALFVQSARRAQSSFHLTPADYTAVTQICRLVGGLPLGIELAASWTRLLSCAEIAQEIEQGLDFLSVSTHNMPSSHHNLRAVFDQSWALLTASEQRVLQALTVFQGSFTRPAAASVAGASLPLLSGLIDKSLLRRRGPDRYSLHELIRQYAAERLRADEPAWTAAREKHGRFYLNQLANSEADLFSNLRGPVFEQLTANIDNLRAAWEWGLAQQQWDLLLPTTRTYPTFYELHSWNQEGLRLLSHTVERLQPSADDKNNPAARLLLGTLLGSQGWFHFRCGQMAPARTALDKGLALVRAVGPHERAERCLQFALFQFGMVAYVSGDYAAAQTALDEALAISQRLTDDWGTAYTLAILGMVRFAQGQATEGYGRLSDSLATWRRNRSPRLGVFCFSFFGIVARVIGKHEEAETALQEGLTLAQEAGDRYGLATFLHSLGALKLAQADYDQAETAVQDSLTIFTELGDRWRITQGQALLATIRLAQGDVAGSETAFGAAFETAVNARALPYALDALVGLADLYAQTERKTAAYALAQRVATHPASSGQTKARAEKLAGQLGPNGVGDTAVAPSVTELLARINS